MASQQEWVWAHPCSRLFHAAKQKGGGVELIPGVGPVGVP